MPLNTYLQFIPVHHPYSTVNNIYIVLPAYRYLKFLYCHMSSSFVSLYIREQELNTPTIWKNIISVICNNFLYAFCFL